MGFFTGKNGVFIIAEIGGNHEGNFAYAKELTRLAVSSNVDAIKYQIYTGETLVNSLIDPERCRHFEKFQLSMDQYIELAETCRNAGNSFMASLWNPDTIDGIDKYIEIYKIGSGDLTAYNMIKKIVERKKPIIISTGLANMDEVLKTLEFIDRIDTSYIENKMIALLQCSSMYPIPYKDANLNVMKTLKEKTGLPVGYSDHTVGMDAVETAVAMGAEVIEMHFTDEREGKEFRDHKISATLEDMNAFIEKVSKIKELQGCYEKKPVKSEIDSDHVFSFRRGLYPSRDINAGEYIAEKDLVTLRPCKGIGAELFYDLINKRIKVNVSRLQELNLDMFE